MNYPPYFPFEDCDTNQGAVCVLVCVYLYNKVLKSTFLLTSNLMPIRGYYTKSAYLNYAITKHVQFTLIKYSHRRKVRVDCSRLDGFLTPLS